jgi:hypothetical protein
MANRDCTAPLSPDERSAVARLLERAHAVLMDDRIPPERSNLVLGFLAAALGHAAVDVRRGHRAAGLDATTAALARQVDALIEGGEVR